MRQFSVANVIFNKFCSTQEYRPNEEFSILDLSHTMQYFLGISQRYAITHVEYNNKMEYPEQFYTLSPGAVPSINLSCITHIVRNIHQTNNVVSTRVLVWYRKKYRRHWKNISLERHHLTEYIWVNLSGLPLYKGERRPSRGIIKLYIDMGGLEHRFMCTLYQNVAFYWDIGIGI